jgi:glycosyltransferase involved in cell wall biosynthesis
VTKTVAIAIDQLSRPQPGGTGVYVRGLFAGLAEVVPDWPLVGVGPRGPVTIDAMTTRREVASPMALLATVWRASALGFGPTQDVWHGTSFTGPFGGRRRATVRRTHMVQDLLWRDLPDAFTRHGVAFHERQWAQLRARADIDLFVTSEALAARLVDDGVAASRLHVAPLGITVSTTFDDEGARALLARVGVEGPFLLTVGTVEPRKNLDRLSEAVGGLPSLPPVLVVGGAGWGQVSAPHLTFVGAVSDGVLASLSRWATGHISVPIAEGWGLPAAEALALGRPLLVSTTVPSVATRGDAVRVDPLQVTAIRAGLEALLDLPDDEAHRQRRRDAVADLTWAHCARAHVAVWR